MFPLRSWDSVWIVCRFSFIYRCVVIFFFLVRLVDWTRCSRCCCCFMSVENRIGVSELVGNFYYLVFTMCLFLSWSRRHVCRLIMLVLQRWFFRWISTLNERASSYSVRIMCMCAVVFVLLWIRSLVVRRISTSYFQKCVQPLEQYWMQCSSFITIYKLKSVFAFSAMDTHLKKRPGSAVVSTFFGSRFSHIDNNISADFSLTSSLCKISNSYYRFRRIAHNFATSARKVLSFFHKYSLNDIECSHSC